MADFKPKTPEQLAREVEQQLALSQRSTKRVDPHAIPNVIEELVSGGKTQDQILARIEHYMEKAQATTSRNRLAQEKRAKRTQGIRAGGAPGTKAEAAAQVKELTDRWAEVIHDSGTWTKEEKRKKARDLAEAIKEANTNIKAHTAIRFKSGGPFLYPTSGVSEYAELIAAGSKGKEVWRLGWGPDKHPTYTLISIDPEKLIDHEFVTSSWCVAIYLVGS